MKLEHEHAIQALRTEQDRIRSLVRGVDERIDRLAEELAKGEEAAAEPIRIAPILKPLPEEPRGVEEPASEIEMVPKVEPSIDPVVLPSEPVPEVWENEPVPSKPAETVEQSESFELTFGQVWLVRIGIVILLTGLVFLGNLAYQHIVPRLGPGAKLSLIVLAGAALGGVGVWLERARESMRNYARVLIAGGCATIYYATYAAHFVQPLKVIESPLIGGALLLGLAGGIGWVAHRRKSETLAVLAVLLSYYTSGLNPIGGFTLFSSLLLTATAIFFLLKHRWVKLTFVSLIGTYVSYAWSRYLLAHVPPGESALALQMVFLGGYWLLFTAGAFFSRRESMPAAVRTPFITLNNGAFFALSTLETLRVVPSAFWMVSLGFGAVLLGLSWLARWKDPDDRTFDSAYLVQGLTLTTLGFASRMTGYQLALTLAAQSVILMMGAGRHRTLRCVASLLSVGGAAYLAMKGLIYHTPHAALTAGAVIPVLGFNGWFFKRRFTENSDERTQPVTMGLVLAMVGLATTWSFSVVDRPYLGLAMASVVCAGLPHIFRFRELSVGGQLFYPTAATWWAFEFGWGGPITPAIPAAVIAIGWALSVWWSRQQSLPLGNWMRMVLEGATALCSVLVVWVWMARDTTPREYLLEASLVGVVWVSTALFLRARMLGAVGLSFSVIAVAIFAFEQHRLPWVVGLAPIAHFLAMAGLTRFATRLGEGAVSVANEIRRVAIMIAGGMTLLWIFKNIPREWQALFFAGTGAACTITGAARRVRELSITGVVLGGVAWLLAVFYFQTAPTWQHLAAVIVFPAACRVGRTLFPGDPTHEFTPQLTWAAMLGVSLWVLRWADFHQKEMSLTIIWTLLALGFCGMGLVLRDRHYRLGGLLLLGLSVGRVFFIDVWEFNQVYRILSFIVLGVALLVVGYFYNRFEEKLRRWL